MSQQLIASRTKNTTSSMAHGTGSGRGGSSSSLSSRTPRGGASSATTVSVPAEGRRTLSRVMASNHQSPSPSRALGRRAMQERVIVELEMEIEELRVKCETYEATVNELRSDIAKMASKGTSKMSLRHHLKWNEADNTYSQGIGRYCKEWLFPRFKFLHETWMDYTESRKGLPRMIFQYCPIPPNSTEVDMWNRVVAPSVAKKYADMRCNTNNEVKKAFKSESISSVYGRMQSSN